MASNDTPISCSILVFRIKSRFKPENSTCQNKSRMKSERYENFEISCLETVKSEERLRILVVFSVINKTSKFEIHDIEPLITLYEDLQQDPVKELARIIRYLGSYKSVRFKTCIENDKSMMEGRFHRKKHSSVNPFNASQMLEIRSAVRLVNATIKHLPVSYLNF